MEMEMDERFYGFDFSRSTEIVAMAAETIAKTKSMRKNATAMNDERGMHHVA